MREIHRARFGEMMATNDSTGGCSSPAISVPTSGNAFAQTLMRMSPSERRSHAEMARSFELDASTSAHTFAGGDWWHWGGGHRRARSLGAMSVA